MRRAVSLRRRRSDLRQASKKDSLLAITSCRRELILNASVNASFLIPNTNSPASVTTFVNAIAKEVDAAVKRGG
jgi:hypothetical protein